MDFQQIIDYVKVCVLEKYADFSGRARRAEYWSFALCSGVISAILNGLYAPDQGLFPPYAGGRYELDGTVMIVSRGLARESTRVPRFYDRPELVIVDLITA